QMHSSDRSVAAGLDLCYIDSQPTKFPDEDVELGADRATRCANDRLAFDAAHDEQVARINRHANARDLTASEPDRGGDDVIIIADGGGAKNDDHVARLHLLADRVSHGALMMRGTAFTNNDAGRTRKPRFGDMDGLVEDAWLQARKLGLHQADAPRAVGLHREGLARPADVFRLGNQMLRHGEGDDLDRRNHASSLNARIGLQRCDGDSRIDAVDRVDDLAVDNEDAGLGGMEIGAARSGRTRLDMLEA